MAERRILERPGSNGMSGSRAMVVANQVRTTGANLLAASSAKCVPIVLTWLRASVGNLAPTGISRAFGCVRIVRERVRDGSFMGLVFTISVEWVGDRWEWSLLMVTANGHWLGCVARCWPKIDAARTNFC